MKDIIIDKSMLIIKNNNPSFDNTKLKEIKYGIESFYLTFTKLIVVLIISLIFRTFRETILLLLFFNILRLTGFGLHASKSSICWISSIIVFIFLPLISKNFQLPIFINIFISTIAIFSYYLYAPADTKKRPLINKYKRKVYKTLTIITGIIFLLLIILIKDYTLRNCITFAMIIETFLILPTTYKFFKLSYSNYLAFRDN